MIITRELSSGTSAFWLAEKWNTDLGRMAFVQPRGAPPIKVLINVSAVSDVRTGEGVRAGRELRARPIQPFGRGRP